MVNSLGMSFAELQDGIYMSRYETRVQDFEHFVDAGGRALPKPAFEQGPNHPIVNVSWEDAQRFCLWLTGHERRAGTIGSNQSYRLPSESEWMQAVGLDVAGEADWMQMRRLVFPGERRGHRQWIWKFFRCAASESFVNTAPVGSFPPNADGFYDMSGNVWEWCEDAFEGVADIRVLKGGSWRMREPSRLALNRRIGNACGLRLPTYGFRVVLVSD